jgi:16S rRNA (cytosine967-C5)-methyltransferase
VQIKCLKNLWQSLRVGGTLLYCTCSVLPDENDEVIAAFLAVTPEACHEVLEVSWGRATSYGRQWLTGESDMDGFYYARLKKC